MKDRYDFSKGKRGRVLPPEPEPEGKTRITIRLDQDIVDRFFEMAEQSGGATGYQTLINAALREYLNGKAPRFKDKIRGDVATHHPGGVKAQCGVSAPGTAGSRLCAFRMGGRSELDHSFLSIAGRGSGRELRKHGAVVVKINRKVHG